MNVIQKGCTLPPANFHDRVNMYSIIGEKGFLFWWIEFAGCDLSLQCWDTKVNGDVRIKEIRKI